MERTSPPAQLRAKRSLGAPTEARPRKREKYARMACALCKVRKVKCSGTQPCSRCEELQSECIYNEPPHPDTNTINPSTTQLDLELSVLRVNRVCEQLQQSMGRFVESHPSRPCLQRTIPSAKPSQPKSHTPTDFRYALGLTRHALTTRLSASPPESNSSYPALARDETNSPDMLITLLQAARPVLELGHGKVTELLTVFKQEIYPLHPCISLQLSQDIVDTLFSLLTRVPHITTYNLEVIDVEIMKSVTAIALLVRGDTQSPLASDLEGLLLWSVDSCYNQEQPQLEDIIMATLLSLYLDLKHKPVQAWRMAGVAAKLCLELGIHQGRFFDGARIHPDRFTDVKRLFACVYDVDKRCSFYSNLPWTLHDRDIDMSTLRLDPQESYLSTMISLDKSLSETWTIIHAPSQKSDADHERVEFLNFQLQKLVASLPNGDFTPFEPTVKPPPWLQTGLQRFCRLRVHHIKMLNYIGSFDSLRDLIAQPQAAGALISSATESVELHLEMMNDGGTSPLLIPPAIKFLLSAVSFMLLVVSHYPEEYGPLCSKPFHAAIEILHNAQESVKDPSLDVSSTLEELRRIAEVIQLPSPPPPRQSAPGTLKNGKQGIDNSAHLSQAFESNVFDKLQTPDSSFFAMLEDVNVTANDMLYMDDIFS